VPHVRATPIDDGLAAPASRLRSLRALIELFHFPPILMVLLACGLFATIAADGSPPVARLAVYLAAVLCSQMAIGVHNDYCDRALDAAAKPWRAIPAGVVSPTRALQMIGALLSVSLALALPLGGDVAILGVIGTAAAFGYNARLKGSLVAWLPFWIALPTLVIASFAVVGAYSSQLLLTYAIGLPLVVPVYIADSMNDIASDRTYGVGGFVQRLGANGARAVCWGALAAGYALALAFWPDGGSPGLLFGLSAATLLVGVAADRLHVPRVHWLATMLAVIALAADWLLDVPLSST
jgi:4-hydroxybenzoate polyprenyltransferase